MVGILTHYNLPVKALKDFKKEFQLPYMNFYKKYDSNLTSQQIDVVFKREYSKQESPTIFPGAKQLLKNLYNKGVNLFILSSHLQTPLENEAKKYGVSKYFTQIFGSVKNKSKKIKTLISKYELRKENTYFAGDMRHDIISGNKNNIKTIAISWGYHPIEKLIDAGADYIVDSFDELEELINNQL